MFLRSAAATVVRGHGWTVFGAIVTGWLILLIIGFVAAAIGIAIQGVVLSLVWRRSSTSEQRQSRLWPRACSSSSSEGAARRPLRCGAPA